MGKIIIEYPDDCTESDAIAHASGAFNSRCNDYKALKEGYRQGVGFTFGDGRDAYMYKTMQGHYTLLLKQKN